MKRFSCILSTVLTVAVALGCEQAIEEYGTASVALLGGDRKLSCVAVFDSPRHVKLANLFLCEGPWTDFQQTRPDELGEGRITFRSAHGVEANFKYSVGDQYWITKSGRVLQLFKRFSAKEVEFLRRVDWTRTNDVVSSPEKLKEFIVEQMAEDEKRKEKRTGQEKRQEKSKKKQEKVTATKCG